MTSKHQARLAAIFMLTVGPPPAAMAREVHSSNVDAGVTSLEILADHDPAIVGTDALREIAMARTALRVGDELRASAELADIARALTIIRARTAAAMGFDRATASLEPRLANVVRATRDFLPLTRSANIPAVGEKKTAGFTYVERELPLTATELLIGRARAALRRGDVAATADALMLAEAAPFPFVLRASDLPGRAQVALWAALRSSEMGSSIEAKIDLGIADRTLRQLAVQEPEPERSGTMRLARSVGELTAEPGSGLDGSFAAVVDIWRRSRELGRDADLVLRRWQDRLAEAAKSDMTVARVYVESGEYERLSEHDARASLTALEMADLVMARSEGEAPIAFGYEVAGARRKVEQLTRNATADEAEFRRICNGLGALERRL
jgi:hypothetical protein